MLSKHNIEKTWQVDIDFIHMPKVRNLYNLKTIKSNNVITVVISVEVRTIVSNLFIFLENYLIIKYHYNKL